VLFAQASKVYSVASAIRGYGMKIARPVAAWVGPPLVLVAGAALMQLDPRGWGHRLDSRLLEIWPRLGHGGAIRPEFALHAEIAVLLLSGTALIFLLWRTRVAWAGLFTVAALAAWFYVSWILHVTQHWAIAAATPGAILLAVFLTGALLRAAEVRALHQRLRLAFSDSLPRATIERIARKPELLSIEGETRSVTYLVCGIRGLADLSTLYRDNPKAFTQLMSQVLSPLMDQALAHGGTIDRLTADGFAAFWNAPLDDAEHPLHACEAANGMSVMAARVNENIAATRVPGDKGFPPVEIGIGIATGSVIAGGFGGHGRLGYSVNGDAVALAGRLQALSAQYGPAVIVSEETQKDAARGFAFLEVDTIAFGGADAPVRLFAILGNPVARASPKFRALNTFHEHIFASLRSQQWDKARALIEQCRKLSGASQTLYDLHLNRIRYFESNPPGPNWDGAFRPILK
jgi:adenylate cyclase